MDTDTRPPDPKRLKTEFCSDNSVSLPGIVPGSSGPAVSSFEPGMFKHEDESSRHSSRSKSKDKEKLSDGSSKVCTITNLIFEQITYYYRNYTFYPFCYPFAFFIEEEKERQEKAQA